MVLQDVSNLLSPSPQTNHFLDTWTRTGAPVGPSTSTPRSTVALADKTAPLALARMKLKDTKQERRVSPRLRVSVVLDQKATLEEALVEAEECQIALEEARRNSVQLIGMLQEQLAAEYSQAFPEIAHLRNQLGVAHGDIAHHEAELVVLREGLDCHALRIVELESDLASAMASKEFHEAEIKTMRDSLRGLEQERKEREGTIAQLTDRVQHLSERLSETTEEAESLRSELKDALLRQQLQDEEGRNLIAAQEELEQAYDDAVAQLELWKREHGLVSDTEEEQTGNDLDTSIEEEDENDDEHLCIDGSETLIDHQRVESPQTNPGMENGNNLNLHPTEDVTEEFDLVNVDTDLTPPTPPAPSTARSGGRNTFKSRLNKLVRAKPSRPPLHALRLFAEKELEDELAELRTRVETHLRSLSGLCRQFYSSDMARVSRLQSVQGQIDERLSAIRLAATKLKAVQSFVA
ncbi:BQ2448_438 [Microbotryum intermedium]|uniref:BQ2448_438 protein n=1 Tax=Microbotryum intermedium TaxID=269621 RepID=A0A238F5K1_9BASI|nr:BQ2448_438 [Microbotryum intermedium]